MNNSAERAQQLIHGLLSYSRIAVKPKPFAVVSLASALNDAAYQLRQPLDEAGGEVVIGDMCEVEVDRDQIVLLFKSLIENALKFRREEPPVVTVRSREFNGSCQLSIEDNGIGFDEKYVDKIFKPFQRLHRRNEYEGMGIGLAISRKIVENHNGTITAKSRPGYGSKFIITLPAKQCRVDQNEGRYCS